MNSVRAGIVPILVGLATLLWSFVSSSGGAHAGERFGLIIANKDYLHTAAVKFADRDAKAIEQLLVNALGVPKAQIFTYSNASMADFRFLFGDHNGPGHLSNMLRGRDSELYVYFVGHGSKEASRESEKALPYLLGVDSRPDDLRATAYSLNLLIEQLDKLQKSVLPDGRVRLILESCFSGRSDAGELITGVSAPALTLPLDFAMKKEMANDRLLVMAAAQGNQFAIWDNAHKQSVFTDALVSGMFGEADKKRFGGNDDGQVSLGEIKRFVDRRIARRVRVVRPGAEQEPDFFGGKPEEVMVEAERIVNPWPEIIRRRHRERLMSGLMLARGDASQVRDYLKTCLYCPRKIELRKFIFEHNRKQVICEIENPTIDRLLVSGTVEEIQSFKKDCECCGRMNELDGRLARLQSPVTVLSDPAPSGTQVAVRTPGAGKVGPANDVRRREVGTSTAAGAQSVPVPPAAFLDKPLLARALQTELHRVGCHVGKIDGKWGPVSRGALSRFNTQSGGSLRRPNDTATSGQGGENSQGRVCAIVCGAGRTLRGNRCVKTAKRKATTKLKKRTNTTKKRRTKKRIAKSQPKKARPPKWREETTGLARQCERFGNFC